MWTMGAPDVSRRCAAGGEAGEPVVAVEHVVGDALAGREAPDAVDELGQVVVDLVLVVGALGAGRQVDDAHVVAEAGRDALDALVLRAREDVDRQAAVAQLARELAHVDVHAAGLLAAEGGEGTGVDAEHGDARLDVVLTQLFLETRLLWRDSYLNARDVV